MTFSGRSPVKALIFFTACARVRVLPARMSVPVILASPSVTVTSLMPSLYCPSGRPAACMESVMAHDPVPALALQEHTHGAGVQVAAVADGLAVHVALEHGAHDGGAVLVEEAHDVEGVRAALHARVVWRRRPSHSPRRSGPWRGRTRRAARISCPARRAPRGRRSCSGCGPSRGADSGGRAPRRPRAAARGAWRPCTSGRGRAPRGVCRGTSRPGRGAP